MYKLLTKIKRYYDNGVYREDKIYDNIPSDKIKTTHLYSDGIPVIKYKGRCYIIEDDELIFVAEVSRNKNKRFKDHDRLYNGYNRPDGDEWEYINNEF